MLTPGKIIFRIIFIFGMVELAIMLLLEHVSLGIGVYGEAVLDVLLLSIFCTPMVYLWIIKPYVVAHRDLNARFVHSVNHDELTGLANRRLLKEHLAKVISRLTREKGHAATFFIDLDGFKDINDVHGHEAGDAMLVETARRLSAIVREEDIVARIGGDEFVVVLNTLDADEGTAREKAIGTANRIHDIVRTPIAHHGKNLQVESSIGIRFLAPSETNTDAIINDADAAMYVAKQARRGGMAIFGE